MAQRFLTNAASRPPNASSATESDVNAFAASAPARAHGQPESKPGAPKEVQRDRSAGRNARTNAWSHFLNAANKACQTGLGDASNERRVPPCQTGLGVPPVASHPVGEEKEKLEINRKKGNAYITEDTPETGREDSSFD